MLKSVLVILFVFLLFLNCKNEQIKEKTNISIEKEVKKERINSFVHSCGSGCVLKYKEINIFSKSNMSYEVKLKVTMYVNEKMTDEYEELYNVYCKNSKVVSVQIKGDSQNVLLNSINDSNYEFRKYGNRICSCKE